MKSCLIPLASILLIPLALPAQGTKKLLPDPGNKDGSTSTPYFSGYGGGIAQQITLGAALCTSSSVLFELSLRADGRTLQTVPSRTFSTLKLSLGYTSNAPANMSTNFAANRTGKQTLVFSGKFILPAQNATTRPFNIRWKLAKPFIYTRNSGNLLVEYEVPIAPTKSNYFLDAHQQASGSGHSSSFGNAGGFSTNENYSIRCVNDGNLQPGGSAAMIVGPFTKNYPAISIWGGSRNKWGAINLPLDLGGLGAKDNFLNVSPDALFGMPLSQTGSTYDGKAALSIPNDKLLQGQTVFTQALLLDAKANAAGMVFSQGLQMTLQLGQIPVQLVGHYDYKSATGFKQTAGTGIVIEYTGTFN